MGDRAVDGLGRHSGITRHFQRQPQPAIRSRLRSALAHCKSDLARELGKDPRLLPQARAVAVLDVSPLAVIGHFACELSFGAAWENRQV